MPFKEIPESHGLRGFPLLCYANKLNDRLQPTVYVVDYEDIRFDFDRTIDYLKNVHWDYIITNETENSIPNLNYIDSFYNHIDKSKTFKITGLSEYVLNPKPNTVFFSYWQYVFLDADFHHPMLPVWYPFWKSNLDVLTVKRKYPLTCLNNLGRYHRYLVLDQLVGKPYFDNILYSYNSVGVEADGTLTDFEMRDCQSIINKHKHMLPLSIDKHGYGSPHLFPKDVQETMLTNDHISTKEAYLNIVLENSIKCSYLTEKSWKPISSGQLFVILSDCYIIESLRKLGYDVFDDIIDHGYDSETDLHTRVNKFIASIDKFMNLDHNYVWNITYERRLKNAEKFFAVDHEWNPLEELLANII